MDFDKLNVEIEHLAQILNKSDLGEISLKVGEASISVKAKQQNTMPVQMPMPMQAQAPIAATAAAVAVATSGSVPADTAPKKQDGNVMKAPIVGTYYASAAPDKPAFVEVGSQVKKGDVLFIIESMKLMNEVQSDFSGRITEILTSDGQGLEYGQPVMIIK